MAIKLDLGGALRAMTERERALATALLVSTLSFVVGLASFFIVDGLRTIEEGNDELAGALRDLQLRGGDYLARAGDGDRHAQVRPAPALQGYLEGAARDAGIEIPESNEKPAVPRGKQYLERSVDLKLRKVNLDQLTRFLERIENGPYTIVTTRLWVRTRYDQHTELDVELTVSTYEPAPPAAAKGAAKRGA